MRKYTLRSRHSFYKTRVQPRFPACLAISPCPPERNPRSGMATRSQVSPAPLPHDAHQALVLKGSSRRDCRNTTGVRALGAVKTASREGFLLPVPRIRPGTGVNLNRPRIARSRPQTPGVGTGLPGRFQREEFQVTKTPKNCTGPELGNPLFSLGSPLQLLMSSPSLLGDGMGCPREQ